MLMEEKRVILINKLTHNKMRKIEIISKKKIKRR
jgi:hypothetical protein